MLSCKVAFVLMILSVTVEYSNGQVPGAVAQPPEVPESSVTPFTATIIWHPPSDPNGPITRYTVNLVLISSDPMTAASKRRTVPAVGVDVDCVIGGMENINRNLSVTGNPPPNSLILDNLTPYTVFEFSVQAENSVGPGPFSPVRVFSTSEFVPTRPRNIAVKYRRPTELLIKWETPECDYGVRMGYNINHEAIHGPLGVQGTLEGFDENDANTVSVTISQLSPYTNYTITLCARTSVGCGNATSTVGQTDEDVPGAVAQPPDVPESSITPFTATIIWHPPSDPNGPITRYTVNLVLISSDPMTAASKRRKVPAVGVDVDCVIGGMENINRNLSVTGNPPPTSLVLGGLTPYTVFEFRVQAENSVGPGPFSPVRIFSTPEFVPTQPRHVAVKYRRPTELLIKWEMPQCDYGVRMGYNINHEAIQGHLSSLGVQGTLEGFDENDANTVSVTISQMSPYTNYTITLCARTSVGCGNTTSTVGQTDEDVPGAVAQPPEVPESSITPFTATIIWHPPSRPNGPITKYTVNLVIISNDPMVMPPVGVDVDCIIGGMENIDRSISVTGSPPPNSLILDGLTPYTVFEFRVQAENSVGPGPFSPVRVFSTPEFVPTQPRDIAVMHLSPTELLIKWVTPQCDYGVRTGYNINHESIEGPLEPHGVQGTLEDFDQNDANTVSVTISQLSPYTNYTITLCARTSVGCGNTTTTIGQTDEDAPNAITSLRITSSRINSPNRVAVEFTWTRPSERNGLFGYTLVYTANQSPPYPALRRNQISDITVDLEGSSSQYSVSKEDGLPFAEYTVEIFAYNYKRGKSVSSSTVNAGMRTIAIEPTEVTEIRATMTSFQSVLVEWNLPLYPNSNISHYIVYYIDSSYTQVPPISDKGYTSITTDVTQSSTRTVEIIDLKPYTNYTIHIRAVGVFNGQLLQEAVVEEVLVRTNITNPKAVRELRAVALSPQSIQVTWLPPLSPYGPISNYIVFYKVGSTAQPSGNIQSVNCMQENTSDVHTEHIITGLTPYTNYTIHVQTVITEPPYVLRGAIADDIVQRTNSTIPPIPTVCPNVLPPVEPTHETIGILIPDPLQIQTGHVIFVAVVIVINPPENLQPSNYLDAKQFGVVPAASYNITAAWSENDIQAGGVPEMYVVGDNSTTFANGIQYINARLNSNTTYGTFVRYGLAPDNEGDDPLWVSSNPVITRTGVAVPPYSLAGLALTIIRIIVLILVVIVLPIVVYIYYQGSVDKVLPRSADDKPVEALTLKSMNENDNRKQSDTKTEHVSGTNSLTKNDVNKTSSDIVLTVNKHLHHVKNALLDAASVWKDIGQALDIVHGTLESIRGEDNECLNEMLTKWMHTGSATIDQLLKALVDPSVCRRDIVLEIQGLEGEKRIKVGLE